MGLVIFNRKAGIKIGRMITGEDLEHYGVNPYFLTHTPGDNADNYWTGAGFYRPEGAGYHMIYSRTAFYYPLLIAYARFPVMGGASNTIAFIGLENGSASPNSLIVFNAYRDRLYVRGFVGAIGADITALAPADWQTASHRYGIRSFKDGAEFFIDSVLKAVVITGYGLAYSEQNNGNYVFAVNPSTADRLALTPYQQVFIGIEDAAGAGEEYTIPIDRSQFGVADYGITCVRQYDILDEAIIAIGATTALADCMPIPVDGELSITIECTYNGAAAVGARLHIRSSVNSVNYDTDDLYTHDLSFTAGATIRNTYVLNPRTRFLKVLVENLDGAQTITDVEVKATLGG